MARINDILNIARSGVIVSQTGLRTTGQNVTNVNTPGYSRQTINVETLGGGTTTGMGVSVVGIRRTHDEFLEKQVNLQRGSYQFLKGRQLVADQLDSVFSEIDGSGINTAMADFFSAFKQVSANVSDLAARQNVLSKASTLADRLSNAANTLDDQKKSLSADIKSQAENGNELLKQLASLNQKISSYADPTGRSEPAELLDQRDEVIRQLAEVLPISTYSDNSGNINVSLSNQVLVEGAQAGSINYVPSQYGGISISSVAGNSEDITNELIAKDDGRGKLAGMLFERENGVSALQNKLDQLAYTLTAQVNTLHQSGYGTDGLNGRNFFTPLATVTNAAKNFGLSSDVEGHPERIAAASSATTAKGDNSFALAISDLAKNTTAMGTTGFSDYFSNALSDLSGRISTLNGNASVSGSLVEQAEAYKSSVSGVSIDEEMVQLIQFQRAFQASAKMVSTVDSMLETIINMKS